MRQLSSNKSTYAIWDLCHSKKFYSDLIFAVLLICLFAYFSIWPEWKRSWFFKEIFTHIVLFNSSNCSAFWKCLTLFVVCFLENIHFLYFVSLKKRLTHKVQCTNQANSWFNLVFIFQERLTPNPLTKNCLKHLTFGSILIHLNLLYVGKRGKKLGFFITKGSCHKHIQGGVPQSRDLRPRSTAPP